MGDVRSERSRRAVKRALLALLERRQLASVTMSELAAEASVSRSTLYGHFSNVQDVYVELVHDFSASLRPLGTHLRCGACPPADADARPFCVALRDAGEYLPVVRDGRFLPTLLALLEDEYPENEAVAMYRLPGLGPEQAAALYRFQMSGCYAVALSSAGAEAWPAIQRTLDAFIRGGLNALRAGAGAG